MTKDPREESARSARDPGQDALLSRLLKIQRTLRETLVKYGIRSGSISDMARQARKVISNHEVRADFLEMLILLHDLGSQAKSRGVLDEAEMTEFGTLSEKASRATAKRHGGIAFEDASIDPPNEPEDEKANPRSTIDQKFSDSFFRHLDDPSG